MGLPFGAARPPYHAKLRGAVWAAFAPRRAQDYAWAGQDPVSMSSNDLQTARALLRDRQRPAIALARPRRRGWGAFATVCRGVRGQGRMRPPACRARVCWRGGMAAAVVRRKGLRREPAAPAGAVCAPTLRARALARIPATRALHPDPGLRHRAAQRTERWGVIPNLVCTPTAATRSSGSSLPDIIPQPSIFGWGAHMRVSRLPLRGTRSGPVGGGAQAACRARGSTAARLRGRARRAAGRLFPGRSRRSTTAAARPRFFGLGNQSVADETRPPMSTNQALISRIDRGAISPRCLQLAYVVRPPPLCRGAGRRCCVGLPSIGTLFSGTQGHRPASHELQAHRDAQPTTTRDAVHHPAQRGALHHLRTASSWRPRHRAARSPYSFFGAAQRCH